MSQPPPEEPEKGGAAEADNSRPDLPPPDQAHRLAQWLAGPRSRALRRARIAHRRCVLEVGCGHGPVTSELQRRAAGPVVALDRDAVALAAVSAPLRVAADGRALPLRAATVDLVFFQNVLLWIPQAGAALAEACRVLTPGGALVALEPDYGGMMEHPDLGLRGLWEAGLTRAGADPQVGRKLPGLAESLGLRVWVELAHLPQAPSPEAVGLLEGLPLTEAEQERARAAAGRLADLPHRWAALVHVPYFLVVAEKPA